MDKLLTTLLTGGGIMLTIGFILSLIVFFIALKFILKVMKDLTN